MTTSDKLREFADKWGFSQDKTDEGFLIDNDRTRQCLSNLTALISEDYVEKAKYDEAVRQRDELREALKLLMAGVNRLPPLTGIHGALENQYKIAEAAIKNTESSQKTEGGEG